MKLQPISNDSPFVTALKDAVKFRRSLVEEGHATRNCADDLCDSNEYLAELSNLCFWASLAVEEGRKIQGSLCICSPDQASRSRAFHESIPISVNNLAALLIASPASPLAVHVNENKLEIWGVLDSVPMFTIKLRLAGAGTVIASDGRNTIAVFKDGEIHVPISASDTDCGRLIAEALDKTKTFPERMILAARLLRIVVAIHRQGHGGTLVIVPPTDNSWTKHITFAFQFDPSSSLSIQKGLNELEEAKRHHQDLENGQGGNVPPSLLPLYAKSITAHQDILNTLLRSIGDLSAIDGAVIMDEELKVYGFSAKLLGETGPFQVTVIDTLSHKKEQILYTELGGTRHQSAARFVYQNHESMVFVASQDGRLTLFVWAIEEKRVVAATKLEHFIWEYC